MVKTMVSRREQQHDRSFRISFEFSLNSLWFQTLLVIFFWTNFFDFLLQICGFRSFEAN